MLTFERLVHETAVKLATNGVDPTQVREVLTDAGIDTSLHDANTPPQGRLIVHNVRVVGEKKHADHQVARAFNYYRELRSGLTAWVGENGSGKSTILSCILWALTGSDSGISKRVRPWIHDVAVQFSVGDDPYTSRVTRTAEGVTGGIYKDHLTFDQIDLGRVEPEILFDNRDEMREAIDLFFMQHLGISTLRWTAHGSQKDDPDLHAHSTTWRTYAHAIHIEDDSYDDLIIDPQKGYGRQDRKILEMMLGVDHSRAVAEIQVEADFAREAYGRAKSRVSGKQGVVNQQIAELEQELLDVQAQLDGLNQPQAPVEADTVFVDKRGRRSALLAEQNQLDQELYSLKNRIGDIEAEILDIERTKIAITEQSEVEYLINSLAVVRCPHCESPVDAKDRLVMERQEHTCHVCTQPLQRTRTRGDLKTLLRERDSEISDLRAEQRRLTDQQKSLEVKLSASREESSKLGRELEQNVQQARDGFSASLATLLVRKGQIEGQIEQLKRNLNEMEAEQFEVDTAARWHTILQTAAEIADEEVFREYQDIFNRVSDLALKLADQFGVPDIERVIIDEKRYVRIVQGGVQVSHNELARSERVKFKIAFHLALMLLGTKYGLGKHPGFLIIDTPGTAEVNNIDFIEMAKDLTDMHNQHGDKVQILMATARTEAIDFLPPNAVAVPDAESGAFF
jgi:hypothetical protein